MQTRVPPIGGSRRGERSCCPSIIKLEWHSTMDSFIYGMSQSSRVFTGGSRAGNSLIKPNYPPHLRLPHRPLILQQDAFK
ncbi:unnamed protein product [Arctogadus glacialis]